VFSREKHLFFHEKHFIIYKKYLATQILEDFMKLNYISTRSDKHHVSASEGIIKGLAPDGGLFVPGFLHNINLDIETLKDLNYTDLAFNILKPFLPDFSDNEIKACIDNAYNTGRFSTQEPVEVKPVGNQHILELFHGPTAAFKDMALTLLPHLMTTSIHIQNTDNDVVILTATSGDTGKAALEGFAGVNGVKIVVFYPTEGVSTIQKQQMITQTGDNTCVIGVDGNFDDAQSSVKDILNDPEMNALLEANHLAFSSANSINIGRLIPQIVYYFYAYFQLAKNDTIKLGDKINFTVPTGNFGNILAGYYAMCMGLPVKKFICASNANNILTDFFNTGIYDKKRNFIKTMSPSMDILISSNLERLLFDFCDGNHQLISQLMSELQNSNSYEVPDSISEKLKLFYGGYASEEETAQTIQDTFEKEGYLLDTHTAVAVKVYKDYRESTGDETPTVVLSTASPYKFARDVYTSILGISEENDFELLHTLSVKTGTIIPEPLRDLDQKKILHTGKCTPETMTSEIKNFLNIQE
jgi:threonine synthase